MKRKLNAIVIHCAATANGRDFKISDVDVWHKARGFKRDSQAVRSFNPELRHVGYHFMIEVDGNVATGRSIDEIGAHVQGSNAKSIGICLMGTDKFTKAQWQSLRQTLIALASSISGRVIETAEAAIEAYQDMRISIKGHRDYSPDLNGNGIIERTEWTKICPGFNVADWLKGGMKQLDGHILEQ